MKPLSMAGDQLGFYRAAPTTSGLALILGICTAIGHHVFYQSLKGDPAPNSGYQIWGDSFRISNQQVCIAAGTVLAFVFKVFIQATISISYQQLAWRAIKSKPIRISLIDDLLSLLTNGFAILNWSLWSKHPLMMVLGTLSWLVPIASVITPASLTVHLVAMSTYNIMRVPRVDFTSMNFATFESIEGLSPGYDYLGPQYSVQRVVEATAAEGQINAINTPSINSSWTVSFHGPALTCGSPILSLQTAIAENLLTVSDPCERTYDGRSTYGYLSWTPSVNSSLPFVDNGNGRLTLKLDSLGPESENSASDGDVISENPPLSLYVAIFPYRGLLTDDTGQCTNDTTTFLQNSTMLQCSLYNASYVANLNFTNGVQDVNMSIGKSFNNVPYLGGFEGADPLNDIGTNGSFDTSQYNTTLIEIFAYQAVMDAFGSMLVGDITYNEGGVGEQSSTRVMSTSLSETAELSLLNEHQLSGDSMGEPWNGLSVIPTNGTLPLQDGIEQLFRNITISLMGSALLQPNYSSPYAPPETNVTITSFHNVYSYSWPLLWTCYSLALLVALLAAVLGVLAHKSNEGTYRTIFSTIMRITKGATLSSPCEDDDDGMDPLPKDLANATLYTCSGAGAKGVSGSPRDSQSMRLLNDQRTSEVTTNHD